MSEVALELGNLCCRESILVNQHLRDADFGSPTRSTRSLTTTSYDKVTIGVIGDDTRIIHALKKAVQSTKPHSSRVHEAAQVSLLLGPGKISVITPGGADNTKP